MLEQTNQTSREIIDKMLRTLEEQKQLLELFTQTDNRDYLNMFQALSAELHEIRKSLNEPDVTCFS